MYENFKMEIQDNCGICLITMKRKTLIRLLPCKHLLHQKCYTSVLLENCHLCRENVSDTEVVEHKKYKVNRAEDRLRIVEAANRGSDWVQLAESLSINYKTAYTWVSSGRGNMNPRGNGRDKSLNDEEVNIILRWVEEKCSITLREIREKIMREFRKTVCVSTVANYLEGQLYSTKSLHYQPITMNSDINKEKRAAYVRSLQTYIQAGKHILYIDETNFNLFCRRTRGRSAIGSRAVQVLPAARGPNIHLIGAIGAFGVLGMEHRRGSFKAVDANEWIATVLQNWEDQGNDVKDLVIVCDNAPCHAKLEDALNGRAALLRLGPYSPMLNPIENIWAKVKSYVKTHIEIPTTTGNGAGEQRLQYLENLVRDAKSCILGSDCARAIQHASTFFHDALALNDMPVGS